jgi:O-antigen/teichoic acid export membrane protein
MDFHPFARPSDGIADKISPVTPVKEDRHAFFRQSSWMMLATIAGSGFMFLVQIIAQRMPKDAITGETEYSLFAALLNALAQMSIPALGLQTVFAQQAGAATTPQLQRELASTVRGVVKVLFAIWVLMFVLALLFQQRLLTQYKIANSAALWFTIGAVLCSLLTPVFGGLMQGRQDFVWFGWNTMFNGFSRFAAVLVLVVFLGFQAAGAITGVFAGLVMSLAVFAWRTNLIWRGEAAPVKWREWLSNVVPLTLGLGTFQFMLTRDPIVVQREFVDAGGYNAARLVGVALVLINTPIALVMFPKIARSHALSEKSNVLAQALGAVGVIGALSALACTLFPKLPLLVMSGQKFIASANLVPWIAWCMLPLGVANVLMNNLFARKQYAVVPWLLAVAIGYGVALEYRHATFLQVMQTLGIFSVLLAAVCVVFTLRAPSARPTSVAP